MGNPQPSPFYSSLNMGKVQRLNGCGSVFETGLRYSPASGEIMTVRNYPITGSLRLNLTQHGETHQVQTK
jgi:hypothetical protein